MPSKREQRIRRDRRTHIECEWMPNLIGDICYDAPETDDWSQFDEFRAFNLQHTPEEFEEIEDQMHDSTLDPNIYFEVKRIERIESPELMAAFVLKRMELAQMKPKMQVHTQLMYHGTSRADTTSIIRTGFDWNLSGTQTGAKWGCGTSFSRYADFAAKFAKPENGVCVMLMCHVLQRQSMVGSRDLCVPDKDCDSTRDNVGKVVVKFDDNTAYPAYRITYNMFRE